MNSLNSLVGLCSFFKELGFTFELFENNRINARVSCPRKVIYLNRRLTPAERLIVLKHELVHITQYKLGEDSFILIFGKEVPPIFPPSFEKQVYEDLQKKMIPLEAAYTLLLEREAYWAQEFPFERGSPMERVYQILTK